MNKKYQLVIIGGGSAGIASAISAYDNGVKDMLVLEKDQYLGGILLQCIHNGFGLHRFKAELAGPTYASRYIEMLKERNIEYKTQSMVVKILHSDNKFYIHYSNPTDGYTVIEADAVVSATGCSERTRGAIAIPGDRCSGVMTAGLAQRYINIDGYMVGKNVFILGSGDIGLIMARRLTLEGANVLGVAEIMPYSNGLNRNIVQCLNDYNIPLYLHHTVKRIIGKSRLEKIVICEVDDNLNFIEGKEQTFEVDTLLLSVGLIPSNPLLENMGVAMHPKTKGPIVDNNLETSIKGLFACGNSLHVHDLVDFVSEEGEVAGRNAARFINEQINNEINIKVEPGNGISYTLPDSANANEDLQIKLRVKIPHDECKLIVKLDSSIVKTIKKQYLLPAEMETIKLTKDQLKPGVLTVEVIDE